MNEPAECPRCAGTGRDLVWIASGNKGCPACNGSGATAPPEHGPPAKLAKLYEAQRG